MAKLRRVSDGKGDQGGLSQAIKWNEEALKVNSTSETALHNIGINLYHMGNYQRAIVYFDKLLKLIPNREGTIEFRNKAMSKLNTQCQ